MQDKIMQAMSFKSIRETILDSDPKADWERSSYIYSNIHFECHFYAPDVNLRFEQELGNDGCSVDTDFGDDWTDKFANKNAKVYGYGLYYASTLIKTFPLVHVDGRTLMPMPEAGATIVSELDYKVAQIHDDLNLLEDYMKRANFTVSPE